MLRRKQIIIIISNFVSSIVISGFHSSLKIPKTLLKRLFVVVQVKVAPIQAPAPAPACLGDQLPIFTTTSLPQTRPFKHMDLNYFFPPGCVAPGDTCV